MEENNTILENKVEDGQKDQPAVEESDQATEIPVDNDQGSSQSAENVEKDTVKVEETASETGDDEDATEVNEQVTQESSVSDNKDDAKAVEETKQEVQPEVQEDKDNDEEDEEEEEENFADLKGDWYVLQVYTGYENRVKVSVEQRIADLGLQDKVFKVLIPMEDTVEIKNNKRVETRKKMYPGYVFINMILEDDVWYSVRKIPGIARFVGGESRPEPVQEGEMLRVLKQVGAKVKKIQIDFEIGETVRVVAGPFRGYTGVIKEINADRGKVKVLMSIFGRETPMELEFDQLEKNT